MKAIILAAGYATRLWPLTKDKPKPLLEVKGKAIIEYILQKLEDCNIDHTYIVTNDKFYSVFMNWKESFNSNMKIEIINDNTKSNEDRLGSLGDIKYVVEKENISDDLIIVAGDNLFEFSLKEIYDIYNKKPTVVLFDVADLEIAKLYGVVSIDENNKIVDFAEKPQEPKSTLSSTGVYFYPEDTIKKLIEFVDSFGKKDKAGDFLEWLYKNQDVYGFVTEKRWIDIGTLNQLEKAQKEFEE